MQGYGPKFYRQQIWGSRLDGWTTPLFEPWFTCGSYLDNFQIEGLTKGEVRDSYEYFIGTTLSSTNNFQFETVQQGYYTTECMMPIFETTPYFTYDTNDLFAITGYDYENPIACDIQTSSIDIQQCLGAEFAVGLWESRT